MRILKKTSKRKIAFAEILLPFDIDGRGRHLKYIYARIQQSMVELFEKIIKDLKSFGFLFSASFRVCLRVFIVGITLSNIDLE